MQRCLYGPGGFYSTGGSAGGRGGDFITSPEVGPLFGELLARALQGWWVALGEPEPWTIYDVGCGTGSLLGSIKGSAAALGKPWRFVGIDIADAGLPADLSGCCVIANELLDNLAFRVLEVSAEGEWREVFIDQGSYLQRPVDTSGTVFEHIEADRFKSGQRAPLLEAASGWVNDVLGRGVDRLCVFDYGALGTAELVERGGWLRTYRNHRRGHDPLFEPGLWDITTDVAVDQLPATLEVLSQANFLGRWGIDELVEEGRRFWKTNAANPGLEAFKMRSRVSEAEALCQSGGLGDWLVLVY